MEFELIRWLRERLPQNEQVVVGPGDDAAVLRPSPSMETVVTTDMLMDGVDFVLPQFGRSTGCDPKLAGRKALAVNLSDLAAMAARPVAALVSLALPRSGGLELAKSLYEGMIPLAQRYGVALVGGDTNTWEGPLCISVTATGEVAPGRAWLRSGALPGDDLLVTGSFGGSIAGKHLTFEPRVDEALLLAKDYQVHAAIDVSDGLSLDVFRLAQESRCGAVIDLGSVPISPASGAGVPACPNTEITPLDHALSDGEDFELVLAVPHEEAERLLGDQPLDIPVTRIGRFIAKPGLFALDRDGQQRPLAPRGWEH